MPITATCPGCGQTLQVADEHAGAQAKCPKCGTLITFSAAPPPIIPMEPFTAHPPPVLPPMPSSFSPSNSGYAAAGPSLPARPFALAGLDPIASILLPLGLFFLALTALSAFMPWQAQTSIVPTKSGIALANATLFLLLCLIVGGIVGTTFYFKEQLRLNAVIGGAFGTFAFFVVIGEMSRAARLGGTGWGLWIGFLSTIGVVAPFVVLAVLRPLEWPYMKTRNMPPLVQRYGALGSSQVGALLFGFVYLLTTLP